MSRALEYVEVDLDSCSEVFGTSPCLAGTDLISNGDFASDITGWTLGGGDSVGTFSSGRLRVTFNTTAFSSYKQAITTVIGQTYTVTGTIAATTERGFIIKSDSATDITDERVYIIFDTTSPVTDSLSFVATATTTYIHLCCGTSGYSEYDDISVVVGDGGGKCFNTLNTCKYRTAYDNAPVTLRFALDTGYNPAEIEAIPNVLSVDISPGEISLGEGIGVRSSVTLTFKDHPHSDAGLDPYLADRSYNPWTRGTFWGKFRVRHLFIRGRPLRVIRGMVGEAFANMETRHYVVDSFTGPSPSGTFQIVAKDVLKLADNDRATCPAASTGTLNAGIASGDVSATLAPSGIGDLEYDASGHVAIGGNEIASFTRSGDVLTITRGQLNTEAQAHNVSGRVQLVKSYVGDDAADILYDLLVTYAGVPASYINLSDWQAETAAYLQRVYTAYLPEPVGVNKLVSELLEQTAMALWWDDTSQQLKLRVLRDIAKNATVYDESNAIAGSISITDQPEKRVSQAWIYYAQRNPLRPLTDLDNYKSLYIGANVQNETDYGSAAIKSITSRWVPEFGSTIAARVADILLARFSNAPRKVTFDVFRTDGEVLPNLGGAYNMQNTFIQDATGAAALLPIQVTSIKPAKTALRVTAEELRFDGIELDDLNDRVITIDNDTQNFNLRAVHDTLFPVIEIAAGITLTVYVNAGVTVGSFSRDFVSFDIGEWIDLPAITLVNNGLIVGAGGAGANRTGLGTFGDAQAGGTSIYTRSAFTLVNNDRVWGGGGGGSGLFQYGLVGTRQPMELAGGGGAGSIIGAAGSGSTAGAVIDANDEFGGVVYANPDQQSGYGGGAGLPGQAAPTPLAFQLSLGAVGAAGSAIDGVSFVTISTAGDRRGTEIN